MQEIAYMKGFINLFSVVFIHVNKYSYLENYMQCSEFCFLHIKIKLNGMLIDFYALSVPDK